MYLGLSDDMFIWQLDDTSINIYKKEWNLVSVITVRGHSGRDRVKNVRSKDLLLPIKIK